MDSTDDSRDDEAREEGSADESVLPPGPRRSTYTPPVAAASSVPGSDPTPPEASEETQSASTPEAVFVPPPAPTDDLPPFIPPPPPAPDFDFLKPETGPVNVVYQLDDIEPNLPFDVAVEALAQSPAGARILPKEPAPEPGAADPVAAEPIAVEPVAVEPIAAEPSSAEPSSAEPSSAEPIVGEPAMSQPTQVGTEPSAVDDNSWPAPFEPVEQGADVLEPVQTLDLGDAAPEELANESLDEPGDERAKDVGDEPDAGDALVEDAPEAAADAVPLPEFDAWEASAPVGPAASFEPGAHAEFEPTRDHDDTVEPDAAVTANDADGAERVDDAASSDEAQPVDHPLTNGGEFHASAESNFTVPVPAAEPSRPTFTAEPNEAPEAAVPAPVVEPDWPFDQPRAAFVSPAPAEDAPAGDGPTGDWAPEPVFPEPVFVDPVFVDPRFADESPSSLDTAEPLVFEPASGSPFFEAPVSADSDPEIVELEMLEPEILEPEILEPEPFETGFGASDITEADITEADIIEAHVIETPGEPETEAAASPAAAAAAAAAEAEVPAALSEAEQLAALSQQGAPAGRPWIPERRSLKDDELASLLTGAIDLPNGTLGVMEELERQLQLREEETREFTEWQESMLAVGTPEAIAAVEKVLPEFTDIVPPGTSLAIAAAASAAPVATPSLTPPPPSSATPDLSVALPPFGASAPSVPAPVGAATSFTPPPVVDEAPAEASFEEALTADQRDAVDSAPPPPPLVEPPAPATPDSWSFDLDADTIVPDPVDAPSGPVDEDPDSWAESSDEVEVVDEAPEVVDPAPEPPSKYAPSVATDAPIFINPIPVSPGAPVDAADDGEADGTPALVEPGAFASTFVDPVYTGPLTGSVSISTGGLAIPPEDLDRDIDDPLDEIDQAGFDAVFGSNPATAPVLVTRVPEDEVVLGEPELHRPRIFSLEAASAEPTPEDQRVGRAARMFWLWFAANASIASMAFGGVLFSLGLSLRQAIVAVLAGVAVSFLPLGLGTLAGKRSGQPTMVVSRAAFGLSGNVLPASIAVISRAFWGAALLWILGQGVASVLDGAGLAGAIPRDVIAYLVMAAGLALGIAVAVFGYGLIVLLQLVSSVVSAILIVGVMVLTWQYVDVGVALTHPDGPWMLAGTAAVLVFSFIGLLWANSSGDLARYQRPGSSTPGSMLSSAFGATIPTFVLISYGALLAASSTEIAAGLVSDPFDAIGQLLPVWYPAPLIAAIVLGLLSAVVISLYSGGFALTAVGVRVSRLVSVVIIGGLIALGAIALVLIGTDYTMLFRDLATTLAVPVAAWAGIFAADAMIRQRTYDTEALLARGGVYPAVNWVNLSALVVIIGVGYGLTTASVAGLGWQGYLFPLLGQPVDGAVAGTDLGVIAALVLGLLVPIVAGIPTIRKQEATARRSG